MEDNQDKSPFERMMGTMLSGNVQLPKLEDIHPEDFRIILDATISLFFTQSSKKGRKLGFESLTDYEGTKIEFSKTIKYPITKKDRKNHYKIVVLPDFDQPEEVKYIQAKEALKEFDCLETVEKYELCLRIIHTFSEEELIRLAKEFDPLKRETTKLEKRLNQRAAKRDKSK